MAIALRYWQVLRACFIPGSFPGIADYLARLLFVLGCLAFFLPLQIINGLCLLADNLIFRRFRQVKIKAPVFIVGVPRSGTTFTHTMLAQDSRFTTPKLWECLFAPSILQRKLFIAVSSLDRLFGSPLHWLLKYLQKCLPRSLLKDHQTSLNQAEEDFLFLLPSLECFLLTLLFPNSTWLWRIARADEAGNQDIGQSVFARYQRLLQRHLYTWGTEKTYLTKNASFSGSVFHLSKAFPDARFVVCHRDPEPVLHSQLRAVKPVCVLARTHAIAPNFELRLKKLLHFYYGNLERFTNSKKHLLIKRISLWELSRETRKAFATIYQTLQLTPSQELDDAISAYEAERPHAPTTKLQVDRKKPENVELTIGDFAKWREPESTRL